jgi:hypothetical protein
MFHGFFSDAFHPAEVVEIGERAVFLARFHDPLGERIADAGELDEFRHFGFIHIDLELHALRLGSIDFDDPLPEAGLHDDPPGDRHQTYEH